MLYSKRSGQPIVRLRSGRADWCVRQEWRDILLGPGAPDWLCLEDDPRAVRVKVGDGRAIWRLTVGQRPVFAKIVSDARFIARLKRRVAGDTLEREWRTSLEAEARGVPVVRSLAVGVCDEVPRRVVLISEALKDAVSLIDAWHRNGQAASAERKRTTLPLTRTVARLFADAHERGFVHGDAHPNNILVRAAAGGQIEAVFIDVHSARCTRRAASLRRTWRSLAQLDQYFHRCATRTQRLRFLRSYLGRRPSLRRSCETGAGMRKFLRGLRGASASHAGRLARTRDRRLRRDGEYFSTITLSGGWRARAVLRLERRHLFPEPGVPDRTESDWRRILSFLVARIGEAEAAGISFDFDEEGLQLEIRRIGRIALRLSATLFGSPHRGSFERCHKERHRDIRNDLILAYAEHRRFGLIDATMLVRSKHRPAPQANSRAASREQLPHRTFEDPAGLQAVVHGRDGIM